MAGQPATCTYIAVGRSVGARRCCWPLANAVVRSPMLLAARLNCWPLADAVGRSPQSCVRHLTATQRWPDEATLLEMAVHTCITNPGP